jgi:Holliday junction resolvasome RuvABC endonuclease subunit
MFTRAELIGMIKYKLTEYGCTCYTVGIKSLKKHITGNGNCKKEAMAAAIYSKYGFTSSFTPGHEDITDAYALAAYGRDLIHRKLRLDAVKIIRQNSPQN